MDGMSALHRDFARVKKPRLDPALELVDKIAAQLSRAQDELSTIACDGAMDGVADAAHSDRLCAVVVASAAQIEQVRAMPASAWPRAESSLTDAPILSTLPPTPSCASPRLVHMYAHSRARSQLDAATKVAAYHREVQAAQAKFCKSIEKVRAELVPRLSPSRAAPRLSRPPHPPRPAPPRPPQSMPSDAEPALRLLNGGIGDEDADALHRAIVSHILCEGHFGAARLLIGEARLGGAAEPRLAQYEELSGLLGAMDARELAPALAWADAHARALGPRSADLAFALHRLRFLQLLGGGLAGDDGGAAAAAALTYGRAFLAPAADASRRLLGEVQQLMGALLFADRLGSSPYAQMAGESHWRAARELLRTEFLALSGLPAESALSTSVRVGVLALPTLTKVAHVLQAKVGGRPLGSCERLPIELGLPPEFTFHSILTCPVSREQCTRDNPPMLLPCGHVISLASISKLSRGCRTARFKCPYCPAETTTALCAKVRIN